MRYLDCDIIPSMEESSAPLSEREHIRLWVFRNYGVTAKIAREHNVTKEFVRNILYGLGMKSKDLRIERALIDAGAPFIQDRIGQ